MDRLILGLVISLNLLISQAFPIKLIDPLAVQFSTIVEGSGNQSSDIIFREGFGILFKFDADDMGPICIESSEEIKKCITLSELRRILDESKGIQ